MNEQIPGLGTALRDRVADEHPDLDRLIAVSTRAGTRLRRLRAAAASVGVAAAGVAMAGVVGAALGGGTAGAAPDVATRPAASTPAEETVTVEELRRLDAGDATRSTTDPAPPEGLATIDELQRLDRDEPESDGVRSRSDDLEQLTQDLPVRLDPAALGGWQIAPAADDKLSASKGGAAVSVHVRPLSDLASWSGGDPDRPASQVVHTGEDYFVTVQPGPDTPRAIVDELTAALRYDSAWKR